MVAFLIRRFVGMVLVLIAVSFIVFLIFIVVPGGDPAQRIAGRTATQQNIENIRHDWGFDQPFYVQYKDMMQKAFTNELVSYSNQTEVVEPDQAGHAGDVLARDRRRDHLALLGHRRGGDLRGDAGRWSDRLVTVLALIGISMPVFWLGLIARYYLAEGGITTFFPDGGYVPLTQDPVQWFSHLVLPWTVLSVLFIGFYGRVLRGEHPRLDQRGLRAHRAREGHQPAPGDASSTCCATR